MQKRYQIDKQRAVQQFRKFIGYRQISLLLSSMANAVSKKPIAKEVAVA
jgi:hypothetical protein